MFKCQNARQSTEGDQMGSSVLDVGTSRITCGDPLMSLVNLVNSRDGSLNCLQMMRKWMRTDCISPNPSTPVKREEIRQRNSLQNESNIEFSMQFFPEVIYIRFFLNQPSNKQQ